MDDDEGFALVISLLLAGITLFFWFSPLLRVKRILCPIVYRLPLIVAPLLCVGAFVVIVCRYADPQVTASAGYQTLFVAAGVAWFAVPELALPLLGISLREDAVTRRNSAAGLVCMSGLLSTSTVFAAANIGTGPTIWTTIGPAALGTAMLVAGWVVHRLLSPAWEDVAVGRDVASSMRVAATLLAGAIILVPAVAGDWVSIDATVHDCVRRVGPLLAVLITSAIVDGFLRPTAHQPKPSALAAGVLPGSLILVIAASVAKWWR